MTGPRERQNTQPRENRKADKARKSHRPVNTFGAERANLALFYAVKIAAAQLYARKDEIAAIIAALKAEERAAFSALRERQQMQTQQHRHQMLALAIVAREVTRKFRSRRRHRRPISRPGQINRQRLERS
jgi:hypothetical protein